MPLSKAPGEARQRLARLLERPPAHVDLGRTNTPVERMPALDVAKARVWVKRDELCAPLYGGGKVRKLEYVLAQPAYRDGHILGVGGFGSHQLVALALYLQARGGRLSALLFDQLMTREVRDNLAVTASMVRSSGGRIDRVPHRLALPWAYMRHRGARAGGRYLTPGASNAVGCLGFVDAAFELAAQIRAGLCPLPSRLYITAGTAGSAAGLAIGLALCGVSTELRLVSAVEAWAFNPMMMRMKLRETYRELRRRGLEGPPRVATLLDAADLRWSIISDAVGPGYGVPTPSAEAAKKRAARVGLALETTYTAKCLAAMLEELEHGEQIETLGHTTDVMWWNTHAGRELNSFIAPGWRDSLDFDLPPESAP